MKISNFIKSVQWELSCSMRTDGRTDRQTDMAKHGPFSQFFDRVWKTAIRI